MTMLHEAGIGVSKDNPIRSLAIRGLSISSSLAFLAPLITRLVIGYAFFLTGRGKWQDLSKIVAYFTDLGIPLPQANAAFIASLELVGGLCLILGLGTRIFSLLLSSTMVVALLTADKAGFIKNFPDGLTEVTPVVYGMFLLWLILHGPGLLSLDHLIRKRLHIGENSDLGPESAKIRA